MKLKKGSVAIYVAALMLVTTGYWNYLSNETKTLETVSMSQNEENNNEDARDEHLGDATLVSNNELIMEENDVIEEDTIETVATSEDEYFQSSKLSRETMYSQTLETYQGILNNSNVSEEQKAIVTQEITELNREKNAIMICENLISTKGFEECVIFVNLESISVIIKAENLEADEIAQIQNIISREMSANVENIHIMTK